MTCLDPAQLGFDQTAEVRDGRMGTHVLSEEFQTLAEAFREGGYRTAAFVDQVHLRARFGFGQGFEVYRDLRGHRASDLSRRALSWLAQPSERPFFLYLHMLDAHWPYNSFRASAAQVFGRLTLSRPFRADEEPRPSELSRQDLRALRARYDAEVAAVDAAIGELRAGLEEGRLFDDTILVVTADHGEAFGEHGALQHGTAPYRELAAVPLVLRLPERLRGRRRNLDEPVALLDLMPTLLDLAGLPTPAGCRGRTLRSLLRGEPSPRRVLFTVGRGVVGARSIAYTLLLFPDDRVEFFDRARDPREAAPLACDGACPELLEKARGYREWMTGGLRTGEWTPLTDREVADLESLGYL
jgi:arylsulfatase A-like enzyme